MVRNHSGYPVFTHSEQGVSLGLYRNLNCLLLVLYVPALRDLFRFAPVPFIDLAVCAWPVC